MPSSGIEPGAKLPRHAAARLRSGRQRQDPRARHLGRSRATAPRPRRSDTSSSARDGTGGRSKFRRRWAGRRVFLSVTGVSRYAKVWIDGRLLGEHIGCLSSAEYDVTGRVAAGPYGNDHHSG